MFKYMYKIPLIDITSNIILSQIYNMANRVDQFLTIITSSLLLPVCLGNITTDENTTLTEIMWNNTETERNRVMNSTFIITIGVGKLDPVEFGTVIK